MSRLREKDLGMAKFDFECNLTLMQASKRERAPELSVAVEDYLKEICKLELAGERATTTALATRLGVAAASVTGMSKRLAASGLIERTPYRGFALTTDGRRAALAVLRHHRLLEHYLAETLGLSLEDAHVEAERLEHAISDSVLRRIDEHLGFPQFDPHGHPIPDASLKVADARYRPLSDLEPGERAVIRRVPDADAALLRYLEGLSLVPGTDVEMRAVAPFRGPLTVRAAGTDHALAHEVAAAIGVD
jgi:DtxR family Mn-dependent transcriptional regulator